MFLRPWIWLALGAAVVACEVRPSEARAAVRACRDYARAFADGAASRCGRGTYDGNLNGFRVSAGVGPSCDLVVGVRDEGSLRSGCLRWLVDEASCDLFDDPRAYLDALPEACRSQLELASP